MTGVTVFVVSESISDLESPGVLAHGGCLGEPEEEQMGMLARRECLRIADVGVLSTGVEAMGILVRRGCLSATDSRVPHPEASPGLLVWHECVGVADVPAMGDNVQRADHVFPQPHWHAGASHGWLWH